MNARKPRGRRAGAVTDQHLARDIAQSAYEDVVGVRPRPHRKDS